MAAMTMLQPNSESGRLVRTAELRVLLRPPRQIAALRHSQVDPMCVCMTPFLILSPPPFPVPSPKYEVLVRTAAYEVRRYARFVAAEAPMSPAPALTLPLGLSVPLPFTGPNSGNGFNELAGYIFGGNDRQSKMDMTTPVLSSGAGADLKMAFPLDGVTEASAVRLSFS